LVGARQCAEHGALHHAGAGQARQCSGAGLSEADAGQAIGELTGTLATGARSTDWTSFDKGRAD
jgi:hypothetical protein